MALKPVYSQPQNTCQFGLKLSHRYRRFRGTYPYLHEDLCDVTQRLKIRVFLGVTSCSVRRGSRFPHKQAGVTSQKTIIVMHRLHTIFSIRRLETGTCSTTIKYKRRALLRGTTTTILTEAKLANRTRRCHDLVSHYIATRS